MFRKLNINIAPARSAAGELQDDCRYIIVSTGHDYDHLGEKPNVCILHFADTEESKRYDSVNGEDVRRMIRFLRKGGPDDLFIACDEGVSRSSAIAAALIRCAGGSDDPIWKSNEYRPNVNVYRTMLEGILSIPEYSYGNQRAEAALKEIACRDPEEYRTLRKEGTE